jgi:predicted metal-dependent phosphoesterase TrpH
LDNERVMRADLHVHSWHSGYTGHLRFLQARDCYSEPAAVYKTAKLRGMDLVTLTDHDTIDGCLEFLAANPDVNDFFISEEIECRFSGTDLRVHIGAYDINERVHREIQPLRSNVFEAAAYLRSEGIFFALNHPLFFFRGQLAFDRYLETALQLFPAFEVRNGTMLPAHNQFADALVRTALESGRSLAGIGGSDSHNLYGIGTTYTEAPGTTREEFLQSLRAGRARACGRHGSVWREAREIYGVVYSYWTNLLGAGRQDLSIARRALGLGFSIATMPFEFSPLVVATLHKRGEARRVAAYQDAWRADRSNRGSRAIETSDRLSQSPLPATEPRS